MLNGLLLPRSLSVVPYPVNRRPAPRRADGGRMRPRTGRGPVSTMGRPERPPCRPPPCPSLPFRRHPVPCEARAGASSSAKRPRPPTCAPGAPAFRWRSFPRPSVSLSSPRRQFPCRIANARRRTPRRAPENRFGQRSDRPWTVHPFRTRFSSHSLRRRRCRLPWRQASSPSPAWRRTRHASRSRPFSFPQASRSWPHPR